MNLSNTDVKTIIKYLEDASVVYMGYNTTIPRYADRARLIRKLINKLKLKQQENDKARFSGRIDRANITE